MKPTKEIKDVPWFIPTLTLHLADGSTLVKPQKAIQRAPAKVVSKIFGISTRTLQLLAESGEIRAARVSPQLIYYYPGEIQEFFIKMEQDPDHWNEKRLREYGLARNKIVNGGRKKAKP